MSTLHRAEVLCKILQHAYSVFEPMSVIESLPY
jgi:hypothetical protein